MALTIAEFFGYSPEDTSTAARDARRRMWCPFISAACEKQLRDGSPAGACTVKRVKGEPVICCPMRLYAGNYQVLLDVARSAFGPGVRLIRGQDVRGRKHDGKNVAVFGRRWGKELRLPQRGGRGGYFVDWVLALLDSQGTLKEFVAVEVQSIDTTGNYREERAAYLAGRAFAGRSTAGLNWENVSKRILPQIIYKGHVLRREPLCTRGLFFVCPGPIYERIRARLGGELLAYQPQPGALTFRWYGLGANAPAGQPRALVLGGQLTTTIDQVALAFTSPANLPEPRVYEHAIIEELRGS